MDNRRSIVWGLSVAITSCAAVQAQPRLFFVPSDADPALFPSGRTLITAAPGSRVCVDIYLNSNPPVADAVQATFPGQATGGNTGSVDIDCASVIIDENHSHFPAGGVFPNGENLITTRTLECPAQFALVVLTNTSPTNLIDIPSGGAYVGEVCYDLSLNAQGTFSIDFVVSADPLATMVLDDNSLPVAGLVVDGLDISTGALTACCLPDGSCQLLTGVDCANAGGTNTGSAACTQNICSGACCVDQVCNETTRAQCGAQGGSFFGETSLCTSISCGCLTNADCNDLDPCTLDICQDGACTSCIERAADVNKDCAVTVFDLFCVLGALAGDDACDQPCP